MIKTNIGIMFSPGKSCTPFVLPVIVLGFVPSTFHGVKSKAIAVLIQPTLPEGEGKNWPVHLYVI
jgi:hypothetical protein